jgi:hypothetical protein
MYIHMTKNKWWNCAQTDINTCKVTNWKGRSKNRADWEKYMKEVKICNGIQRHLKTKRRHTYIIWKHQTFGITRLPAPPISPFIRVSTVFQKSKLSRIWMVIYKPNCKSCTNCELQLYTPSMEMTNHRFLLYIVHIYTWLHYFRWLVTDYITNSNDW